MGCPGKEKSGSRFIEIPLFLRGASAQQAWTASWRGAPLHQEQRTPGSSTARSATWYGVGRKDLAMRPSAAPLMTEPQCGGGAAGGLTELVGGVSHVGLQPQPVQHALHEERVPRAELAHLRRRAQLLGSQAAVAEALG